MDLIIKSIDDSKYKPGKEVFIALDVASSEFFKNKLYNLNGESLNLKSEIIEHENFLKKNRIDYVDCNFKLSKETLLVGDYHPNRKAHKLYEECITSYLKRSNLLF